jgi:DNA-binding MarR family transcriptional regulator
MTCLVQRLERDAYVTRQPDPVDARATLIEITAAGRDALDARAVARAAAITTRLEALSTRERDAIARALPALDALVAA